MFYSIKELVEQADLDFQGNVAELMITTEFELTGREREEVFLLMERNLEVMKASVQLGLNENKSRSGLTGGDAAKLDHYIKTKKLYQITRFSLLPEMLSQSMNTMPKWAWSVPLQPLEVLAVSLPFSLLLLKN
ncbi:L-serine dehydratase, iron-sulfur-dependent, alpha subunit [Streptococcus pneumoniae GA11184]|nr:L-serine dehydratase, iron-sulfur-dependent, alpha subunit [Streptococcus pneumoniae GA11184]